MKILVTGAAGFVGKNLCASLHNIREGKDRTRPDLSIEEVFEYDLGNSEEDLKFYCSEADFVFNLAGVNRPKNTAEFMEGNFGFAEKLLNLLEEEENLAPVMLSSSIQATLAGPYEASDYGASKLAGENLFFDYGKRTGAKILVYRLPNLFGKWSRPNYNSVVATFCHNMAHDLPIHINDPSTVLNLLYIDDLVAELLSAAEGKEHRCDYESESLEPKENPEGLFCFAPGSHKVSLGEIVELLESFTDQPKSLLLPSIPPASFAKKLYSTYLSFLPHDKIAFPLKMNKDERGSFTELLRTEGSGQFSVNISEPGVTKGEHWHHTKWEFFIVVSGRGLIRQRKVIAEDFETEEEQEVLDFYVDGENIQAVHMLPGYTHNIINLSHERPLITLMWANENFDPSRPDTYRELV